jgi:hypothetical protein
MPNAALLRYIHGKVLAQADRARRGVLEPDKAMSAISAPAPDKNGLYVLVNETSLGVQRSAVYKSASPGSVVYSEDDVREEARGDAAFEARAREFARVHTLIPAVTRKYFRKEGSK